MELLEKFNISTEPVLFRGDSSLNKGDVAKKFMEDIVEVGRNIDRLLNTNMPFVMTDEDNKKHREVADHGTCPFCKSKFNSINLPVRGTSCNFILENGVTHGNPVKANRRIFIFKMHLCIMIMT